MEKKKTQRIIIICVSVYFQMRLLVSHRSTLMCVSAHSRTYNCATCVCTCMYHCLPHSNTQDPPPALYDMLEGMKVGGRRLVQVEGDEFGFPSGQLEIPPGASFNLEIEVLK